MNKNTLLETYTLPQEDFNQFRKFLQEACGISLGEGKQYLVSSRIRALLESQNMHSVAELLRALKCHPCDRLKHQVVDAMTTNETFWFRDNYPYEYFTTVLLPKLQDVNANHGESVRIWSAACSSGQEAYSLSICVEEYKQRSLNALSRNVDILATDLSSKMLDQACLGKYDQLSILRGLSFQRREMFFDTISEKYWRVKKHIQERVKFQAFNLLDSYQELGDFDIIFCRNVLIYFDTDLKHEILKKMHACLKPGGTLILGSSESLGGLEGLYEMVPCESGFVYRAC